MNEDASTTVASRESHLDWLRSERAAFELHESQMSRAAPASEFAVGNDGFVNLEEEEPVYRSLSMAGPAVDSPVYVEEEPVYRSLNFADLAVAEPVPARSPCPAPDAHSSWAAQKRPPLLRRQNAFATRDPSWLDSQVGLEQESGS